LATLERLHLLNKIVARQTGNGWNRRPLNGSTFCAMAIGAHRRIGLKVQGFGILGVGLSSSQTQNTTKNKSFE
jgi:hypothetical protein